jgi:hypothetical protein
MTEAIVVHLGVHTHDKKRAQDENEHKDGVPGKPVAATWRTSAARWGNSSLDQGRSMSSCFLQSQAAWQDENTHPSIRYSDTTCCLQGIPHDDRERSRALMGKGKLDADRREGLTLKGDLV